MNKHYLFPINSVHSLFQKGSDHHYTVVNGIPTSAKCLEVSIIDQEGSTYVDFLMSVAESDVGKDKQGKPDASNEIVLFEFDKNCVPKEKT